MSENDLDVLAVGPHPDDVELCCGGTLARLAGLGYRVGVLDLTRGELASNGTPEQRAEEAAAAAGILRLTLRENLGLPDGGLSSADPEQTAALAGALRRLRPEIVLSPPARARHPDHEAAAALLRRAVFFAGVRRFETAPAGERYVPAEVLAYEMRVALDPGLVIDVSDVYDLKRQAIACYGSQIQRQEGAVPTLVNAPETITAIEARDARYGAMIGVRYGEPLALDGPLATRDPLALLRQRPGGPAHLFRARR